MINYISFNTLSTLANSNSINNFLLNLFIITYTAISLVFIYSKFFPWRYRRRVLASSDNHLHLSVTGRNIVEGKFGASACGGARTYVRSLS